MNLLEYEAKHLLRQSSIPVPKSTVISDITPPFIPAVVKSQVPVGGRGKLGGVKLVSTQEEARQAIESILNLNIKGFLPKKLLIEEMLDIKRELYVSLTINKEKSIIELIAHHDGGVEIESQDSDSFLKIDLSGRNFEEYGGRLADYFDTPELAFSLADLTENLHTCFIKNDTLLLEINPLVITSDNHLVAGDCKMVVDDAAVFRHPEWNFEETPANSNFVTLDAQGEVATIANGAGLAMATVDAVAGYGMKAANFLDIGGGANTASVLGAFNTISEFSQVKAIVINIFAGITRCDEVARAIIEARNSIDALPPLFIRLAGTNYKQAEQLLTEQDIATLPTLERCLEAARMEIERG